MNKYPDFWSVIIGPGPVGIYLGFIVVAYVCAMVSLLLEANSRDVDSKNTPKPFSGRFLWAANYKRILANVLALPILVRITYPSLGMEAMFLAAIGIGVMADRAALWLKSIGVLSSNKSAARVKAQIEQEDKKAA